MRRGGEEQSYLRSYLRVIFVYIGKRAEITSFTLFALPPYVGYPPLTQKLARSTCRLRRLSSSRNRSPSLPAGRGCASG